MGVYKDFLEKNEWVKNKKALIKGELNDLLTKPISQEVEKTIKQKYILQVMQCGQAKIQVERRLKELKEEEQNLKNRYDKAIKELDEIENSVNEEIKKVKEDWVEYKATSYRYDQATKEVEKFNELQQKYVDFINDETNIPLRWEIISKVLIEQGYTVTSTKKTKIKDNSFLKNTDSFDDKQKESLLEKYNIYNVTTETYVNGECLSTDTNIEVLEKSKFNDEKIEEMDLCVNFNKISSDIMTSNLKGKHALNYLVNVANVDSNTKNLIRDEFFVHVCEQEGVKFENGEILDAEDIK